MQCNYAFHKITEECIYKIFARGILQVYSWSTGSRVSGFSPSSLTQCDLIWRWQSFWDPEAWASSPQVPCMDGKWRPRVGMRLAPICLANQPASPHLSATPPPAVLFLPAPQISAPSPSCWPWHKPGLWGFGVQPALPAPGDAVPSRLFCLISLPFINMHGA